MLHPMVLAPAVAIINSLGNLGGFVAPYGFGLIKEATGQVTWGLYGLAIASALGAILVLFIRKSGRSDDTSETAVANAENIEVGDPTQERLTR
jgi:nitrate/nitrite transporter NarK